jgi:hypothetical protein
MVRQNPVQPLRARGFLLQICFATSNLLRISRAEFWELVTDLAFGTQKTLAVPPYCHFESVTDFTRGILGTRNRLGFRDAKNPSGSSL